MNLPELITMRTKIIELETFNFKILIICASLWFSDTFFILLIHEEISKLFFIQQCPQSGKLEFF